MARYTGSVCKICRREGEKMFLKGTRCLSDKCSFQRRSYPPGQHGRKRQKPSSYRTQLREKQKIRKSYNLLEKQFRLTFQDAVQSKGKTGDNLLILLERRLDNVVYRSGFTESRNQARQLIRHGHFQVNGAKVNIPSYRVRIGEKISVREKSKEIVPIQAAISSGNAVVPSWLEVDNTAIISTIVRLPMREDVTVPAQELLVVELYSK
ncbi:30S ribosomal protein S4 [candidate division CSSED10-310 bacterium]|uniref:Small ribosomal subunit protein uS4 n=1 Tax=candidate division CSSED10-310 bacterium TaxID=2855610 RepID=A0ABV6YYY3_UNCC1